MKPRQFYRTYPRNVGIFVTGPVFLTMPLMHLQQRCSFTVFILSVYTCTCNDKCVHCPLLQPCNTVGVRSAVALIYLYLTMGKGYYGYAVFVVVLIRLEEISLVVSLISYTNIGYHALVIFLKNFFHENLNLFY